MEFELPVIHFHSNDYGALSVCLLKLA